MNVPSDPRLEPRPASVAAHHLTSAALTVGVAISAACFLVALGSELIGNDELSGDMTDIGALVNGVLELAPWAWASLGIVAIVLTPVAGLVATAYEYAANADRRTMWLAIVVLAIMVVSVVTAILH